MHKFILSISIILLTGCVTAQSINPQAPIEQVLSAQEQAKLTPDIVIARLKAGNARFVSNEMTVRNHKSQIRKSVKGQYPKAIVLSCVDSRVPVEDVFDLGIGDVFVARVAGNFVNKDILGSMEFATKVAGAKVVLVMGHDHCGAVKAAIDNVQLGNITSLVKSIRPAVKMTKMNTKDKSSKNEEFVRAVCENNVKNTISDIRSGSSILKNLESEGVIKIIGAVYDMDTGKVVFQ